MLGDGPHAVLSCKGCVTLWPTHAEAISAAEFIDATACGGGCRRRHRVINLEADRR